VAWLLFTGLRAQHRLTTARAEVLASRASLLDSDLDGARRHVARARESARAARSGTDDIVWRAFSHVPLLGAPLRSARGVSAVVADLTEHTLPQLLDAGDVLSPSKVRQPGGRVDLAAVTRARAPIASAVSAVHAARARLRRLPHATYLPYVDHGLRDLERQVDSLTGTLGDADTAARLLPPMLGQDGVRRYFIAFQTNAEARGTGGLPGAFGILHASGGVLTMERLGTDEDVGVFPDPVTDLGAEFTDRYDDLGALRDIRNSNISPHFPYAAAIWAAMWEKRHHQHIDGAVATDPVALADILGAVGPVTLPDGQQVTKDNVVDLTLRDAYARFTDQRKRKAYLQSVSRAVTDRLLAAPSEASRAITTALGKAAGQGRLQVASLHDDEQRQIAATGLAGVLPDDDAPFAGVYVTNASGGKLDYYLERSVRYAGDGCDGKRRATTVEARIRNAAPKSGLPDYVVTRGDDRTPEERGTERLLVSLYATKGAEMTGITVDGKPSGATVETERGRPVYTADVEVPPGGEITLVFRLDEPTEGGEPRVPVQPLVRPMNVTVDLPTCRG
jgi:hypothetical protein